MSDTTTCRTMMCDRPSDDGIVCRTCLKHLEQVLAETRWIMNELDLVAAKEVRYTTGAGKVTTTGASLPLVVNLHAADVRSDYVAKLTLWTADLSRSINHTALAAVRPTIAGAWLLAHLEDVRTHPAAGDMIDELCQAYATAMYVIDRPFERRYLGDCGYELESILCTEPLWCRDGDTIAVCRTCGTEWDAVLRRHAIQQQAVNGMDDRIMTATQAAETLVAYGVGHETNAVRLRDRIRKWAEQPKCHDGTSDPNKRPVLTSRSGLRTPGQRTRPGYRLGDVIKLVNETDARRRKAG